jgi:hypothetical protein
LIIKSVVGLIVVLACAAGLAVLALAHDRDNDPPDPSKASRGTRFPNRATTGVPRGWTPARTRTRDLRVTRPGSVVQDILLRNADLIVAASNVTVRRVKMQGGGINNVTGGTCRNGPVVRNTTFEPPPGHADPVDEQPAIASGGYTARRVELWRRGEGLFVSGKTDGCGPVRVKRSFLKMVLPDEHCGSGTDDWHTDGIQGFGGSRVIVHNTTIDFREASCGTAPFFYPHSQGNTSAKVDRLLLIGGGYPFRLGMPARVTGLKIAKRSWVYGPIDVKCSVVSRWRTSIVTVTKKYQVARRVRRQRCNTEGGG